MDQTLKFYGAQFGAAVPLLFFVVWAVAISVAGAPDERGLILGMIGGLTLGSERRLVSMKTGGELGFGIRGFRDVVPPLLQFAVE